MSLVCDFFFNDGLPNVLDIIRRQLSLREVKSRSTSFPPNLGCGQTGFTGGVCSCKVAFLDGHCSLIHDNDDDDDDDDNDDDDDGDHDDKFSTKD